MTEKRILTYEEALVRLARYCSKAERCEQDVCKKLREWGVDAEEWQRVVRWLKEQNFLNEERYVESFVREKMRINRWGEYKVAFALAGKGVDRLLVERAIGLQDADEAEDRLRMLLTAKLHRVGSANGWELQQKLYRFAMSRGYSSGVISKVMRELLGEYHDMDE